MPSTFAHLVTIRSRLVEDLAHYYESVIAALDATPWYRNNVRIRTSDIAIPAPVLNEDSWPRVDREGRGPDGRKR